MTHRGLNFDLDSMHIGHLKHYEDDPWLDMLSRDGFETSFTEHLDVIKGMFPRIRSLPGPYEVCFTMSVHSTPVSRYGTVYPSMLG